LTQYSYDNAKQYINDGADVFTIVPEWRNLKSGHEPLVIDGKVHIFLNSELTRTDDYNRFKSDFAHELVHGGGYAGKKLGIWDLVFGRKDLDYLGDKIKAVERECGDAPTPP